MPLSNEAYLCVLYIKDFTENFVRGKLWADEGASTRDKERVKHLASVSYYSLKKSKELLPVIERTCGVDTKEIEDLLDKTLDKIGKVTGTGDPSTLYEAYNDLKYIGFLLDLKLEEKAGVKKPLRMI